MLAALVFALVGQLFQLFEHGFVSLAGGKNDRKQRKIVVFVRLYQLGADLLRVLPPVIKRLLIERGHGEQQTVFVCVARAAGRHQTEDFAGRAGVENAQQRRHSAGNLHVLLGAEMRILPVQQLVAQGNKFSRKVHKQPRFFTDRRDNRRFPS